MAEAAQKVSASHLKREAYLYIRQSTIRQVLENTESTKRQYELQQRALALGWPMEHIQVIDCDLGQSGASAVDREGFKRLVSEVSLGRAGIVLGLEVSRLARNCADWHRLLELCALSDTLILDEDGLYNPNNFNDRLLLGLKGTMSEAELHLLRLRCQGGILNKARRGELASPLPIGFVYDEQKRVQLDPDKQVRQTIALFFKTFRRAGSAYAAVKHFSREKILFPRRLRSGPGMGELIWGKLGYSRALTILRNPRYAGAFFFGRRRYRHGVLICGDLPRDEWHALIPDMHEGYISWNEYEDNLRRLRECATAHGQEHRTGPPREGSALLQGLAICGVCGRRMWVNYRVRSGHVRPDYVCHRSGIENGPPICQYIRGSEIDKAVGELLLSAMTPITLEVALAVQQELTTRLEEADRLRAQQVERARYEADLAQRRYMWVDPSNRLVADTLEGEWNQKLRALREAQDEYQRQREIDRMNLDEEKQARIMALATDFPKLWNDPDTQARERKRMVRLLLEDVTLIKKEDIISAHVRFRGGSNATLSIPNPPRWTEASRTPPETIAEIDRLLNHHTEKQIAAILNKQGLKTRKNSPFTSRRVHFICYKYGLKSRYQRLREAGLLTMEEVAELLKISVYTVKKWRIHGLLQAYPYNDKNECLYEPLGSDVPTKCQGRKLSERRRFPKIASDRTKEVQYAV